jgi:hypothetical protein
MKSIVAAFSVKFHLSCVLHLKSTAAADLYLAHCAKSNRNPTSIEEQYLQSFLNQV